MNTTENKSNVSVIRVDHAIALKVRREIEGDLGVPVSLNTAINRALQEYLDGLVDEEALDA